MTLMLPRTRLQTGKTELFETVANSESRGRNRSFVLLKSGRHPREMGRWSKTGRRKNKFWRLCL